MQTHRSYLSSLFDYFVFGNLFIAICASMMSYYTFAVYEASVNYTLLGFIFFASISSYSLHSYLPTSEKIYSQKVAWILSHKKYLLTTLIIGITGSLIFLFLFKQDLKLILALTILTVLYSSPKIKFDKFTFFKKFGTAKTFYLAAIWTLVTVSLPLSLIDSDNNFKAILFFVNRFLLIYTICILFDLKDKEYDIKRGIKSIVTILEEKTIELIFYVCIVLFFLTSLLFYIFRDSGLIVLTLITPGVLLFILLGKSKETQSDYWYSFVLDGIMMLSTILYLLFMLLKKIID